MAAFYTLERQLTGLLKRWSGRVVAVAVTNKISISVASAAVDAEIVHLEVCREHGCRMGAPGQLPLPPTARLISRYIGVCMSAASAP